MNAGGAATRRRLAARARLARQIGMRPHRAERFRRRLDGNWAAEPSLSELRQWPLWPGEETGVQNEIWTLTALVSGRDSLLDEIDGARLRRYAAAVREDRFEHVLALPRGGDRVLVLPAELLAHGKDLAHSGLPEALARQLGLAPATDSNSAAWVADAEAIAIGAL
jgi:hypothetical protein